MEIKAQLLKPYTESQKTDFIVEYNHNQGFLIEETETALIAKGYTDEELLNKAKEAKTFEINTIKEATFKEGIVYKGAHFDCDDRAQDRTGNRLILLQAMPVECLEWLDYDYQAVELTAQEFQELCAKIFERIQFIEFKTGQLLEAVNQAQSIEELEVILPVFSQEEAKEEEPEVPENDV